MMSVVVLLAVWVVKCLVISVCCLPVIQYRVLVFPRLKLSGGGSTTANCWLSIGGQYGETEQIQLPKHTLDITIKVCHSLLSTVWLLFTVFIIR